MFMQNAGGKSEEKVVISLAVVYFKIMLVYFILYLKHVDLYVNYKEFVRNRVPVVAYGSLKPS